MVGVGGVAETQQQGNEENAAGPASEGADPLLEGVHGRGRVSDRGQKNRGGSQGPAPTGEAGDGLLSHLLSEAVPSTLQGLTTVFGMGTGVAPAR